MSEPINLNRFRKSRDKADKIKQAEENRVRFGRTKADRELEKARASKAGKHLDGHLLNDDE